jgi:hypothetical protein
LKPTGIFPYFCAYFRNSRRAIAFDIAGTLFPLERPIFKFLALAGDSFVATFMPNSALAQFIGSLIALLKEV